MSGKRSGLGSSLVVLVLLLLGPGANAQPAFLVADLNTSQQDFHDPLFLFQDFAVLGTDLFFLADDGLHGIELWKTDGTPFGTAMVEDICPGSCWGRPSGLTVSGGVLYFTANDGVHGYELWRSDGSPAGTFLVKDILPGREGGASLPWENAGQLLFSADDGAHGWELWTTDGTAAGTQMLADLRPGPEGSEPAPRIDVDGGFLFSANDGVHGTEPWMTDGTAAGTRMLRDIEPGPGSSSDWINPTTFEPDALVLPDGSFLFTAFDGAHGTELWSSDGTEAGTARVADIAPGVESSSPFGLTLLGGTVFFTAYDPTIGWELWKTDGTPAGTALFKDLNPAAGSSPREMRAALGRLFFRAYHETLGSELWTSDGTVAGTSVVKDVNPGSGHGLPFYALSVLGAAGGAVLFFADDGVHGSELWKTDGTEAGTVLVKDIFPGAWTSFPGAWSPFEVLGSHLYLYAFGPDGVELWKSDGSGAGTSQVRDIANLTSSMRVWNGFLAGPASTLGGDFVFPADDGMSGLEPWRTNGTLAGTQPVADLVPGFEGSYPQDMAPLGDRLLIAAGGLWSSNGTAAGTTQLLGSTADVYSLAPALGTVLFSSSDATGDQELWKTDGTPAGTVRVKDIRPGESSSPNEIVPLGSSALFAAEGWGHGRELWITDGTAAGTVLVKDLVPGALSSYPSWLTRVGGQILFFASDPTNGRELWKSDGTAAGTAFVKDIHPGFPSSINSPSPAAVGTTLFFTADDGVSGRELWKSDGTAAGTVLVKDVLPGARSSDLDLLTRVRDRVFFVADDGAHGRELWVSDGTAAGTRMVEDLVPGEGSSRPGHLRAVGHVLLFSAFDPVHGVELWVSDGTEAGTALLQDIAPGSLPSSPLAITPAGDKVGLAANDGVAGFEPWIFPRQVLGSTFADVPPGHWAWLSVEALADAGITRGCAAGSYCPGSTLTRAEVAVFLGRATHYEGYAPPAATGTRFQDVPASHWAGAWIEQIATDGITQGCSASPPLFCPGAQLSRAEMAIFLLRAKHGGSYTPPPATGTRFTDVPASYWAAAWIEQLAAEGISLGCTANQFCPGNLVTRAEMAVFLTRAFGVP